MGCALGVVLVTTAACGSWAAAPTGSASAAASAPCGPRDGKTLAADARARIFSRDGSVYGCARAGGRAYLLGRSSVTRPGQWRNVGVVALGGVDAAYSTTQIGVDTLSAEVVVRRLDNGRMLHTTSATTAPLGPEFFQTVDAIVVKSDGAVAWIATGGSIIRHARKVEVDRIDRRGQATLDRGTAIATRSLRLRGSQLSWRHGSASRSAMLL